MNSVQIVGVIGVLILAGLVFRLFGRDYLVGLLFFLLGVLVLIISTSFNLIFETAIASNECSYSQILNLSKGKSCGATSLILSYGLLLGGLTCIFTKWASTFIKKDETDKAH